MSDKYIPGGSKIIIEAPSGFRFSCTKFETDDGLSNTTTCYVKGSGRNIAEFTIDSQDPKQPHTQFALFVRVENPEFTPLANYWKFNIVSPLGRSIDLREKVHGFDITGTVEVTVNPLHPFLGQTNPLRVTFVPSTIMNQADEGNELVLNAPGGYIFPRNCTGFYLRLTQQPAIPSATEGAYPTRFTFPPPGIECIGFDNNTVVIRMPDDSGLSNRHSGGLLRNNYTLEVDVLNPKALPDAQPVWTFITRVRNTAGMRIVDANTTIDGFEPFRDGQGKKIVLKPLVPINMDESTAPCRFSMPLTLPLLFLVHTCWASGRPRYESSFSM